jgi:hypothetical protein
MELAVHDDEGVLTQVFDVRIAHAEATQHTTDIGGVIADELTERVRHGAAADLDAGRRIARNGASGREEHAVVHGTGWPSRGAHAGLSG